MILSWLRVECVEDWDECKREEIEKKSLWVIYMRLTEVKGVFWRVDDDDTRQVDVGAMAG